MMIIRTGRLDLVAATSAHLEAELVSPARLGSLLGANVPEGWPPGEYDRPAVEFFLARLTENPGAEGWYGWYAIERAADGRPATLVGAGGYFGPPGDDGTVEIGYSILPDFRGRGFATELVQALIARAFATPGVGRVIAHAFPENIGSAKVLERTGFVPAGPGREPGTVRYVQPRPVA
jgi:ribosomal-protein-alanine N-acetyltransferase